MMTLRGREGAATHAWRSPRLWSLLADLEESMGSSRDVEGVYEKMMELRIATPQVRIGRYLESRR